MQWRDLDKARRMAAVGAVYLLRELATGRAKIGWAFDVERRTRALQTGNPHALQVAAVIAATRSTEASLHGLFADRRIRGEWFDDSDGEISFVFSGLQEEGF